MAELVLGVDGKFIIVDGSFITPPSLDGGLQNKSVVPTIETQIITADEPYLGLDSVTVGAIQTEQKTITPSIDQQIIVPTSGKFLSKVTVDGIYAVIAVTYPEGSVCTCTNGTKTFTAKDTSGKALFNVTAGEWTVKAEDTAAGKSKSANVSITEEGHCESVELSYRLYLYKNGDEFTDITNGWNQYRNCGGTIIKENDNIALNLVGVAAADTTGYVITSNKIDLTKYKKLVINSDWVKSESTTGCLVRFGIYSAPPATWSDVVNPVAGIGSGSNILDVSSISDEYYILVGAYMSGQTNYYTDLSIKEVYME